MNESNSIGSYRPGRYAAIDIGTVTARLLIADVSVDGLIDEVYKDHVICNLGVGVDKTGILDSSAIERTESAVARFVEAIGQHEPADGSGVVVVANATSASRDARNSGDFVSSLEKLGVHLAVIPGEKEAALSFSGASSAFAGERVVVLDVGGGSSEIVAGIAGEGVDFAHSFNIGCRRVTERFFRDDPPTSGQLGDAGSWIAESMRDYLAKVVEGGFGACRIVAVAGTATSIVSMRERMVEYDSSRVHGAEVSRDDVEQLLGMLSSIPLVEREEVVGLDPGRAPVIVAGVLIIQEIMRLLGAESFTASERDILHGIILDSAH